jgi:hypothetical protein
MHGDQSLLYEIFGARGIGQPARVVSAQKIAQGREPCAIFCADTTRAG